MGEKYVYVKKGKLKDGSAKIIIQQKKNGEIKTRNLPSAKRMWLFLEERTFSGIFNRKMEDKNKE